MADDRSTRGRFRRDGSPSRPQRAFRDRARERMRAERESERAYLSRRAFIGLVGGAGALAAVLKLADYQIVNAGRYRGEADARRLTAETLFAKRGTIYDRNGNVLASSVECSNVYVNPKLVKDASKAVSALVSVLGVTEKEARAAVSQDATFAYVKRQVDQDDADRLMKKGVAGIGLEQAVKRVYPYGALASQVLGVVNVDNQGATGLEHEYDKVLTGQNGSLVRERGRDGGFIAGGAYKKVPATDGEDLVISIDATIQQAAEQAMEKAVKDSGAKYGSAIACDPTTGEILAACSYPTYDQSDLESARTEDMNLRAVTDAYEPGSVFKTLVAGAAIDLGLMDPDTTFTVPASVKAGDDDVTDVDGRDHTMTMTLREILRRSSNTGMVLVGERIGADGFASYLKRYGIGTATGVDFPGENTGIVKERSEYDGASVGAMSFGQSLAVAPIEILRAETGIANGGTMSVPHFLKSRGGEEFDWEARQARCISEKAAGEVVSMMRTVVEEGTGRAARIEGYDIAGKTGTAQRAVEGRSGYQSGNNMASFLGFATPDDPRAMVYVTLDGTANTSQFAMPPFVTIMQACIAALGIKKSA